VVTYGVPLSFCASSRTARPHSAKEVGLRFHILVTQHAQLGEQCREFVRLKRDNASDWYNRHWNLRVGVQEGRIKIVEKETYPKPAGAPETIQRDVWLGALKAARKTERDYGKKHLGPWDDFEWGMINGKLSALRWALGDDWDMLDT
jgi:hypothetical protein